MTTVHFKAKPGDWLLSDKLLREAVRVLDRGLRIHRTFDIPYLAGYSTDGDTIFIDRHLASWKIHGGSVEVERFLVIHEAVEKAILMFLEKEAAITGNLYLLAHQIALHVERDAVESSGYNWSDYNDFCAKQCKRADSEKLTKVPKDLDLTPYKDERDYDKIKAIVAAGGG